MTVSDELQLRIQHRIVECISIIERKFKKRIPSPRVSYDVVGTVSAKANCAKWMVRLNPVLLVQNVELFIAETVPHEVAHLATDMLFPHAHRPVQVGTKKPKRQVHGKHWAEIMTALGVPANATHEYDLSSVRPERTRYVYQCNLCERRIPLGPRRHSALRKNPSEYHCKCSDKSVLTFVETIKPTDPMQSPATSKFNQCKAIYDRAIYKTDRKTLLDRFVYEVGCTRATASSYYSRCKVVD